MTRFRWWLVCAGLLVAGVGSQAEAVIVINEVLADPAGDADGDGALSATKDEFVELLNTGSTAVSLKGWLLKDALNVRHAFADADAAAPGQFFVVFGSSASTGTLSLNNSNETVTLLDADQQTVDALAYGSEGGKDASLARQPDGTGAFALHALLDGQAYSPGRTLEGLTIWPPALPPQEPSPLPDPLPELPPVEFPLLPEERGTPMVPEPSTWLLLGAGLPWLRRRGLETR